MEEVKPELVQIDLNKLCRACLSENSDMRNIFLPDASTGEDLVIADMLTNFTNIEVFSNDGLPSFVCLQCTVQIGRAYSFKRLCVQSDSSLRQYLGKPSLKSEPEKSLQSKKLPTPEENDFTKSFLEGFGLESTSESEEEELKDCYTGLVKGPVITDPFQEKVVAQQQLIKLALSQKNKSRKKKLGKTSSQHSKSRHSICNVCQKKFSDVKLFRKHLRSHIEDRPFKCTQCSRTFTEENYLNNHMRSHVPEEKKPHECNVCKKRFIHSTMLQKHFLRHTNEKPFVCKICNKGCFAENSLIKHMKIHEKKVGDPGLLKHICDYCRTEFSSAEALSMHIKQHSGSKPFVCNVCTKCFPQRFNLELHLRVHTGEKPFNCEVCKKGFVSKAGLKIHMRTHTNERPFACNFCGKAFRQSGDLTSHKRLHGTGKPIECEVCQKRFTTMVKLKYHMRNHTGERPYVCNVCNRGFTVNTILLRHMRVHSGERPYVCVTCGRAFSQTSTLNNHMKVHSAAKGEEKELKFENVTEKFSQNPQNIHQPINQQQPVESQQHMILHRNNRMIQEDGRIMQPDPLRVLHPDTTHDASRLLTDSGHMLTDNRGVMPDDTRILVADPRMVVNVVEPTRLLVSDNRLLTMDNRVVNCVNDNRHLPMTEGTRVLTEKYLGYGTYQRGHL